MLEIKFNFTNLNSRSSGKMVLLRNLKIRTERDYKCLLLARLPPHTNFFGFKALQIVNEVARLTKGQS